MKPFNFENKKLAKRAGKKGGKRVPPEKRYFSVNRAAAAAAGRKSQYAPPAPGPVYDDTKGKALYESFLPEYRADLLPWEKLTETTRQLWRKQADVRPKDGIDAPAEIDLLWDASELRQGP